MPETEKIFVFHTTLRDGEQAAGVCFSQRDKLEIAARLEALGVDVIEAGFPGAARAEREAVAAVAHAVREASVCALARAVPADVDAAGEALREALRPRIHVFLNASDVQLAHQLRRSRGEVLDPADVGRREGSEIVLGKLSGCAGFAARVRALGVRLSPEALEGAFARFQALADGRGDVGDDELRKLLADATTAPEVRGMLARS